MKCKEAFGILLKKFKREHIDLDISLKSSYWDGLYFLKGCFGRNPILKM